MLEVSAGPNEGFAHGSMNKCNVDAQLRPRPAVSGASQTHLVSYSGRARAELGFAGTDPDANGNLQTNPHAGANPNPNVCANPDPDRNLNPCATESTPQVKSACRSQHRSPGQNPNLKAT